MRRDAKEYATTVDLLGKLISLFSLKKTPFEKMVFFYFRIHPFVVKAGQ
jgi:hypothetical protein